MLVWNKKHHLHTLYWLSRYAILNQKMRKYEMSKYKLFVNFLQTRILVTHGVHWLPMVDTIVVLIDGRITELGSYEELLSHDGAFAQFLKTYLTQDHGDDEEEDPESKPSSISERLVLKLEMICNTHVHTLRDKITTCEEIRSRNS